MSKKFTKLERLIADYEKAIRERDIKDINRLIVEVEKEADRVEYPNHARLAHLHTQAESIEPWMTSYSAIPRTIDETDYIITNVAAKEFQLYRHEAEYLYKLLGEALGEK